VGAWQRCAALHDRWTARSFIAVPRFARLNASLNSVVWVTSVYLLTYAVPMLLPAGSVTASAQAVFSRTAVHLARCGGMSGSVSSDRRKALQASAPR